MILSKHPGEEPDERGIVQSLPIFRRLSRSRITGVPLLVLLAVACSCNSPDASRGQPDTSPSTPTGGSTCEGVIAAKPKTEVLHDLALATFGDDIFVMRRQDDARIIRRVVDGGFTELARISSPGEVGHEGGGLVADADSFYVDAWNEAEHDLYRLPRAGGEPQKLGAMPFRTSRIDPAFVADADYIYFPHKPEGDAGIARVARKGDTPEMLGGRVDLNAGAMTLDGTNLYLAEGKDGGASLQIIPKESRVPPENRSFSYKISPCGGWGADVQASSDGVFFACGVNPPSIARVPTIDESAEVTVTPLLTLKPAIYGARFVVHGGNIYFVDDDTVFRTPVTGGARTRLLGTSSVSQMITDGKNLFIASNCGIQRTPL